MKTEITLGMNYGHGGFDTGTTSRGLIEKDIVLQIGKKVTNNLKPYVKIFESRKGDEYDGLKKSVDLLNSQKLDYIISFHANYYGESRANGVEIFYYENSIKGKELATTVLNSMLDTKLYKTNRGIKSNHLYITKQTKAPTILIELGFVTNDHDRMLLTTKQEIIAKSISDGILKFLNIKVDDKKDTGSSTTFYRVVTDSYIKKDNAIQRQKELKTKGINSFIDIYKK